jgi:hypothetical protein
MARFVEKLTETINLSQHSRLQDRESKPEPPDHKGKVSITQFGKVLCNKIVFALTVSASLRSSLKYGKTNIKMYLIGTGREDVAG